MRSFLMGASIVISWMSYGMGCGPSSSDCFGLGQSTVDVRLTEPYVEGAEVLFDQSFVVRVNDNDPSCGTFDALPEELRFLTRAGFEYDNVGCYVIPADEVGPVGDVDWTSFESFDELVIHGDSLEQAILASDVVAQGPLMTADGCLGRYTLLLYNVTPGTPGTEFDAPTPGERPQWLLTRIFEPRRGCDGVGLPAGARLCADTWVAQLLSAEAN